MSSPCSSMLVTLAACLVVAPACAQHTSQPATPTRTNSSPLVDAPAVSDAAPTIFPHPANARYLISGQANIIFQAHAPFHSPYEGFKLTRKAAENTRRLSSERCISQPQVRSTPNTPAPISSSTWNPPAAAASRRLSASPASPTSTSSATPTSAPGPTSPASNCTRHFGFTGKHVEVERTQYSLATEAPGTPPRTPHRQDEPPGLRRPQRQRARTPTSSFMNWTADNNGAWDYAADTRGYTYAAVSRVHRQSSWSARYALGAHANRSQRHPPGLERCAAPVVRTSRWNSGIPHLGPRRRTRS